MTGTIPLRFVSLLCAAIAVVSTMGPGLDAGERLTLKVTPAMSFAPATVHIEVRFEPSADNRALEIEADSENFYRSSRVELGGDRAPRIVTLDFRGLPSGRYEISGALKDGGGQERAFVRQQAVVIPSGPEH